MTDPKVKDIIDRSLLNDPARDSLVFEGDDQQVFPLNEVKQILAPHPEFGQRIRALEVRGFREDNNNRVQVLEFIVRTFPNLTKLVLRHEYKYEDFPLFSRLTKLEIVHLNIIRPELESLERGLPNIPPFAKVRELTLDYDFGVFINFGLYFGPLFPSIEVLLFTACTSMGFRFEALADIKSFFPKLSKFRLIVPTFVRTFEVEEQTYEYRDQHWARINPN